MGIVAKLYAYATLVLVEHVAFESIFMLRGRISQRQQKIMKGEKLNCWICSKKDKNNSDSSLE